MPNEGTPLGPGRAKVRKDLKDYKLEQARHGGFWNFVWWRVAKKNKKVGSAEGVRIQKRINRPTFRLTKAEDVVPRLRRIDRRRAKNKVARRSRKRNRVR